MQSSRYRAIQGPRWSWWDMYTCAGAVVKRHICLGWLERAAATPSAASGRNVGKRSRAELSGRLTKTDITWEAAARARKPFWATTAVSSTYS